MSIETDPGFWKWLAGGLLSALGAFFGYQKYIDARLEKKADKHAVNNALQEIKTELAIGRTNQGKLFDQIRDSDQRAQDRHERMMEMVIKR